MGTDILKESQLNNSFFDGWNVSTPEDKKCVRVSWVKEEAFENALAGIGPSIWNSLKCLDDYGYDNLLRYPASLGDDDRNRLQRLGFSGIANISNI